MKVKNPVSQNIRIFPKINQRSTNDSISEIWHESDQPVALLRHY